MSKLSPVSSKTSRLAASHTSSPGSIRPAGRYHCPAQLDLASWKKKTMDRFRINNIHNNYLTDPTNIPPTNYRGLPLFRLSHIFFSKLNVIRKVMGRRVFFPRFESAVKMFPVFMRACMLLTLHLYDTRTPC